MKSININARVRVKLLPRGVEALQRHEDEIPPDLRTRLKIEINRWAPGATWEGEMWEMAYIFGSYCMMGPQPPFETEIEILD